MSSSPVVLATRIGLASGQGEIPTERLVQYINLKLATLGFDGVDVPGDPVARELAAGLIAHGRESQRLLANYLPPTDWRIQRFLDEYLYGARPPERAIPRLPSRTFVLDRYGIARLLSLPVNGDTFTSPILSSYRVAQGVLHNPRSDRRTTKGIFHVTEGGLPIPDDKLGVPKGTFATLLERALNPPAELLQLPFTSGQARPAECFVSLLLRPLVLPPVPGYITGKSMEVRFFAPGSLVANLDFVESIFGNAGDPILPANDAALSPDTWTGHTGCVILAPHLVGITKKDAGLPSWDKATPRQQRDGMCWRDEAELYNEGRAFKLTCRDHQGVIVTLIADNYFGYCKKEVKTQLSYSANLFGLAEEEHAGGALVFPSYDLGEEFSGDLHVSSTGHTYAAMIAQFPDVMEPRPEGYAVDRRHADILYVPEDVHFDLHAQVARWEVDGQVRSVQLRPTVTYVRPSGYQVRMEKPPGPGRAWRLVGTVAEPTLCHKPCTVSGGGKSEISKPISDAILTGPVFVADFKADFDRVAELIERNYADRFIDPARKDHRAILSHERSLGSVIKLLTPSNRDYTRDYNDWLRSVPQYVKELVFVVKRYYKPDWQGDWRRHFSVDIINGVPGNELKCDGRKLVTTYLRVGFDADGAWRVLGLRKDFHPAAKLQMEDDITASVVVPAGRISGLSAGAASEGGSVKFVANAEYRLFQRPDDAVHRGYDRQTEADFTRPGNFFSNYEPLPPSAAAEMVRDTIHFEKFTEPMQVFLRGIAEKGAPSWFACTANPRIVEGKPSKNPRYLQVRPDLLQAREVYLHEISMRLRRRIPLERPVPTPVDAVLPGRRNNPPDVDAGIRPLAVFNPIHYMELPELFMEFICSMTGKSPSTTGAGSEGALTKGPFNALPTIIDLNNALVSYLLTGHPAFVTAAGYVGPQCRVDHDVSLLVPEVWCRMTREERDPAAMIRDGYLERCVDFEHAGQPVLASRLGWRITEKFCVTYLGRIFNHPHLVFTEAMLRPERQDPQVFADGMANVMVTQQRVAAEYFADGTISLACPPLRALLHIMRDGNFEGMTLTDPAFRRMFTREAMLDDGWYEARLMAKQQLDVALWQRHVSYLEHFRMKRLHNDQVLGKRIAAELEQARARLAKVQSAAYREELAGTLGVQPLGPG